MQLLSCEAAAAALLNHAAYEAGYWIFLTHHTWLVPLGDLQLRKKNMS